MPQVRCPRVRAWVRIREKAEMKGQQLVAGFVMAFLDDWFPFLCGSSADISLGHQIIMAALDELGFRISEPKLLEEGTPAPTQTILGHGFDLTNKCRFITGHKRLKRASLFRRLSHRTSVDSKDSRKRNWNAPKC